MNKLVLCLVVCVLALSTSVWAQPGYLVKIDGVDQRTVEQIKGAEIEVYAKAGVFWVAGATRSQLDLLTRGAIAFRVLDREADIGEHYLVRAKPKEDVRSRLAEISSRCQVLFAEENVAVVKGNPRRVEQLASFGFSLRRINKRPLPVDLAAGAPSDLLTLPRAFDPLINSIIERVDQDQLLSCINDLSGEDTVLIQGMVDSIKTRYSYSDGATKAADYLKVRFEEMGIDAEMDTFQVSGFPSYFLDVACSPDAQKVWSVNYYGGIIRTTDGGNVWELIDGTESFTLYDICRVDDDTLWCVGNGGIIIRSTDGGDTWEDKSKPEFGVLNFRGCYFENVGDGWVVGDEKVLYTSDGGANWTEQAQVVGLRLYAIDFVDPYRGWTVGDNGTVLHTTDRGTNWNPQASGTSVRLRSADFVDQLNGWACGDDGWAIYTTDAGANWTRRTLSTSTSLNNVFFLDGVHGWMVGYDGNTFQTSDLGSNWVSHPTPGYYMYGIGFADTLTGWASGYYEVLKSTDGGQSWFSQYGNLEAMDLVNVVATLDGSVYPDQQVLITGHYDDVSEDYYNWAPGADDNASGAVSLLAAADILKDYGLVNTVKFVAFSGEEQGLLGSAAYAQQAYLNGDQIAGVLNFDMIAWDGNGDDVIELHCGFPAANQALADLMIDVISDYGLSLTAQKITSGATDRSDHASFWDYAYPAILGIEDFDDFNPYYHSTGDRVSAFDVPYYVDFTKAAVAGISILADPFIVGDVNEDMAIDLGDVVYLLNYLFKGYSPPDPLQAGDTNSDGVVDLGDVVYLLNYLFKGGDPPH